MPFFDNFNGIFLNTTGNGEKFLNIETGVFSHSLSFKLPMK